MSLLNTKEFKNHLITYGFALIMTSIGFFLCVIITYFKGPNLVAYIIIMSISVIVVVEFSRQIHEKQTRELHLSNTEQNNVEKKLKESYTELEERVRERTQDLKNANIATRNVLEDLQVEKVHLAEAKAKDEAMLVSIGEGMIAIDPNKKIIIINKVAEKLLGFKINEVIGKNYDDFIFLEDENGISVPPNEKPFYKVCNRISSIITTNKLYIVNKNKIKFPVAITASPVILDDKIVGVIEVFRDITEEKAIDKAKTEFVSLASHQLRTPLTTISWYTEMVLGGDVGKVISKQKKYLKQIYQGNHRMIELVNTLLDVSRIELGTFMIKPKPTNIITLIQSVVDEQKLKIKKKKLALTQKMSKNVPILSIDPKFFAIVFQNILLNAINYTSSGGKIELGISLDKENNVIIKISDTGYGIPKNQQDKIFTKLFRADNIRDKGIDGTGLGLYITKSIIENSGGKIWFESKENKGTSFFVMLPIKENERNLS